jgi:hypothetical protein
MFKKALQQGLNERRGEAYSAPYVEPLSDARTTLETFFNILLISNPERRGNQAAEAGSFVQPDAI